MGRSIAAVLLGYVAALILLALTYTGFARWFPEDIPHYGSPLVMPADGSLRGSPAGDRSSTSW
jgi:hypothetical protein